MKKLYRSNKNKAIFGVLAGLAEYLDLDVSILRLIFVILALFRPTFLLIYLIAALVIPKEPEDKTDNDDVPIVEGEIVE